MKILKKEGIYRKVPNDWIADNLVKTMGWSYSTRSEWKNDVRDLKKTIIQTAESLKKEKKDADNTNRTKSKV